MQITRKVFECEEFVIGYYGARHFLTITKNKKPSAEEKIEAIIKLLALIDVKTENIPRVKEIKKDGWKIIARW